MRTRVESQKEIYYNRGDIFSPFVSLLIFFCCCKQQKSSLPIPQRRPNTIIPWTKYFADIMTQALQYMLTVPFLLQLANVVRDDSFHYDINSI